MFIWYLINILPTIVYLTLAQKYTYALKLALRILLEHLCECD